MEVSSRTTHAILQSMDLGGWQNVPCGKKPEVAFHFGLMYEPDILTTVATGMCTRLSTIDAGYGGGG